MGTTNSVNGETFLHNYIEKDLSKISGRMSDEEMLKNCILNTSIWFPHDFYKRLPIMLPYVVRDNSCRKSANGVKEEWGTANEEGFFRDDNSLIKGIPKRLVVKSPQLDGDFKMGNGFGAHHIWRTAEICGDLCSGHMAQFNSFVPNLVWLPALLHKHADRKGSFAKYFLQAISYKLYRNIRMPKMISAMWKDLPLQRDFRDMEIEVAKINFFSTTDYWILNHAYSLNSEMDIITSATKRSIKESKIKCSRYLPSLVNLPAERREGLNNWLIEYKSIIQKN